jgi:uncharacterized protein YciI
MALTIKDALRLAQADPNFANELMTNPQSLKSTFNLSDAHVAQLQNLGNAALAARTKLVGVGPVADYD